MRKNLTLGFSSLFLSLVLFSCSTKIESDLIIHNGFVYTIDSSFHVASAMAVKDGKILATGSDEEIFATYHSKEKMNLDGKFVYPGFIDAHCHFLYYGLGLSEVNLNGTKSFDEVIKKVIHEGQCNKSGWMKGRGWDQNDWEEKEYPNKYILDSLYPNSAIFLKRIDGHAALANSEAMRRAGITLDTKIEGGKIEIKNGVLTGILIDNAVDLVENAIPLPSSMMLANALQIAEKNCFKVGLTTIADAGLKFHEAMLIDSMHKAGALQMRVYGMLSVSAENEKNFYGKKSSALKTDRLNLSSVKLYGDGALGSRGACLLSPYDDKKNEQGFLLNKIDSFIIIANYCFENGYQLNAHCIGDSANRLMLNIYGEKLKGKNDRRWRIEHAQVVHPMDIHSFGKYSVIPSVQPTHCTSDMYWAENRLGESRIKYAYAYKQLLDQNNMIAAGSDFPVEAINPLFGFYAAVARKDQSGFPENGFQMENSISREQALKAMTLWAAYSCFEDLEKGSLEKGKFADFVVLDDDLLKMDLEKIPNTKVLSTYINGVNVYSAK